MTPPVDGADLRAALEASCLRGALPPVDLPVVVLVMCSKGVRCDEVMCKGKVVMCSTVRGGGRQSCDSNTKVLHRQCKRCSACGDDVGGTYGRSAWCGPLLLMDLCCVDENVFEAVEWSWCGG